MVICQEIEDAVPSEVESLIYQIHCERGPAEAERSLYEICGTSTAGGSSPSRKAKNYTKWPPSLQEFEFDFGACDKVRCVDTGVLIPAKEVLAARRNEMLEMQNFKVWHYVRATMARG